MSRSDRERQRPPRRPRPRGDPGPTPDPAALGDVLGELTKGRPWAAGLALGRLARRWSDVVGERLAEETAPAALEGGVLLVRASSAAWAAQVRFLSAEVAQRANAALGAALVRDVRVGLKSRHAPD